MFSWLERPDWNREGRRFDPDTLHKKLNPAVAGFFLSIKRILFFSHIDATFLYTL